jgi:hypothetical protein
MPGIATSDMSRSGAFNRAAVSASSGQVKNFAENPFHLQYSGESGSDDRFIVDNENMRYRA